VELPAFLDRVLSRLPASPPTAFTATQWAHGGRPTDEGFAILPIPGLDPAKAIDAVMDVDHYVGNLDHVATCRSINDPRFVAPEKVRFYQRVEIPMLGAVLALPAILLGILGLRSCRLHPQAKGKAHAWVGITTGLISVIGHLFVGVFLVVGR
jgi:hypothetical protein